MGKRIDIASLALIKKTQASECRLVMG